MVVKEVFSEEVALQLMTRSYQEDQEKNISDNGQHVQMPFRQKPDLVGVRYEGRLVWLECCE